MRSLILTALLLLYGFFPVQSDREIDKGVVLAVDSRQNVIAPTYRTESSQKPCPSGYTYNPATLNCEQLKKSDQILEDCTPGSLSANKDCARSFYQCIPPGRYIVRRCKEGYLFDNSYDKCRLATEMPLCKSIVVKTAELRTIIGAAQPLPAIVPVPPPRPILPPRPVPPPRPRFYTVYPFVDAFDLPFNGYYTARSLPGFNRNGLPEIAPDPFDTRAAEPFMPYSGVSPFVNSAPAPLVLDAFDVPVMPIEAPGGLPVGAVAQPDVSSSLKTSGEPIKSSDEPQVGKETVSEASQPVHSSAEPVLPSVIRSPIATPENSGLHSQQQASTNLHHDASKPYRLESGVSRQEIPVVKVPFANNYGTKQKIPAPYGMPPTSESGFYDARESSASRKANEQHAHEASKIPSASRNFEKENVENAFKTTHPENPEAHNKGKSSTDPEAVDNAMLGYPDRKTDAEKESKEANVKNKENESHQRSNGPTDSLESSHRPPINPAQKIEDSNEKNLVPDETSYNGLQHNGGSSSAKSLPTSQTPEKASSAKQENHPDAYSNTVDVDTDPTKISQFVRMSSSAAATQPEAPVSAVPEAENNKYLGIEGQLQGPGTKKSASNPPLPAQSQENDVTLENGEATAPKVSEEHNKVSDDMSFPGPAVSPEESTVTPSQSAGMQFNPDFPANHKHESPLIHHEPGSQTSGSNSETTPTLLHSSSESPLFQATESKPPNLVNPVSQEDVTASATGSSVPHQNIKPGVSDANDGTGPGDAGAGVQSEGHGMTSNGGHQDQSIYEGAEKNPPQNEGMEGLSGSNTKQSSVSEEKSIPGSDMAADDRSEKKAAVSDDDVTPPASPTVPVDSTPEYFKYTIRTDDEAREGTQNGEFYRNAEATNEPDAPGQGNILHAGVRSKSETERMLKRIEEYEKKEKVLHADDAEKAMGESNDDVVGQNRKKRMVLETNPVKDTCSQVDEEKIFANPVDCRTYYRCVWGKMILLHCPDGLVFSPDSQICDFPSKVPSCAVL